ncbi:GSCOCG00007692001-RA-CDS [Cotesia congregata]|uniref:Similar to llph: Protein LLP homolog (Danio rerio) n=1 Tax=Cotesia congregata TaxID=51543 RepID=A0A8J2MSC7_COTCN|nr:GSCOCG00007692001-RA-CDS [Cotesia congregata]CAG5099425.1 Similar to llph: Protein LLP homolog (Danio rerio) [Cotesia congregata]
MAKSLRSKWRRKCRAVKRERYGAKELATLKKTLGIDENGQQEVELNEISEIATVVDAKTIKAENEMKADKNDNENHVEQMDQDGKRVYNKKTMKDQYGQYPIWMSSRKIAKHKKGRGKNLSATSKSSKRLTKRQKKMVKKKGNSQNN